MFQVVSRISSINSIGHVLDIYLKISGVAIPFMFHEAFSKHAWQTIRGITSDDLCSITESIRSGSGVVFFGKTWFPCCCLFEGGLFL